MTTTTDAVTATATAATQPAADATSPMAQFQIERYVPINLFGFDASFTNSALAMLLAAAIIVGFIWYAMRRRSLIPDRVQSVAEMAYEFVHNIVKQTAGEEALGYFPFIFTLFMFILVSNLLGLINIPGLSNVYLPFTSTSHIIVTFALAATVFVGVTLIGIYKHGIGFLKLFVPSGVPWLMLIILVPIEVISYFTRPISLSVRLFANMMAGHTLLKVFGGFVVGLGLVGGWAPLLFMVPFTGLEVLVAFLQAYVFAILTSIYLNDALHIHH